MKLVCTRLLVEDFPASFQFWRDVMRLPLSFGDEGMGYAYFTAGDVGVELMSRDGFYAALGKPATAATGSQTVLDLQVADVDATYTELIARGATALTAPTDRPDWMARTAHFTDPAGNIIEMYTKL